MERQQMIWHLSQHVIIILIATIEMNKKRMFTMLERMIMWSDFYNAAPLIQIESFTFSHYQLMIIFSTDWPLVITSSLQMLPNMSGWVWEQK